MTDIFMHQQTSTSPSSHPAAPWVRFLRSYGPTPNDLNLFDEYVTQALAKAKVQPISLPSPELENMKAWLASGRPGSILVAGTAGDGKTYHCRHLWISLGGAAKDWAGHEPVKQLMLDDGRTCRFVKDLSEISDERQSDEILEALERTVFTEDNSNVLIIAANHGQILERLRELGIRQRRTHPLRKPIEDVFLLTGTAPVRLGIFDLSRVARRNTLSDVLAAVANHPEWNKCAGCYCNSGGRTCPIVENKERILGHDDDGRLSKRLGDLVEISRHNGWHLPVRDLLALAANMVLGHRDAKEGLLSCTEVPKVQESGTIERGSIYDNVFGANLPRRRARDRQVFRALEAFGIGEETTNGADGLLVYGADDAKLKDDFERLVKNDLVYGATQSFLAAQTTYLEGDEEARREKGAASFIGHLISQRRRLFFTLPDNSDAYPYWAMNAFLFGGHYLALISALQNRQAMKDTTRSRLAMGLNRVMTGLLLNNDDRLFVASSGGFTQSRISVLCDTETPSRRQGGIGMHVRIDPQTERPIIEVALADKASATVEFNLTPVRFEFLCRVAEGALPGSFSNECLEDMLAFKAKLLRKAELLRYSASSSTEEADEESSTLSLNFIEIENTGYGFSRPVTVRTAW